MNLLKIKNIKTLIGISLISAITLTGCNKFLDINDNPNNPDKAEPSLLLPTVQASISQVVGNAFQIYGGIWSQYWTQNPTSSQYRSVDQYQILNTATDRSWQILFRNALNNAELIINSEVEDNEYYKGIAYILKAYAFQVATDAFGDVPLSEALKGADFMNPTYESQEVVYDSIFAYLEKGQALFKSSNVNVIEVSTQDMFFSGDLDKWDQFANTLALRAYLRLSEVDQAKAAAGIKKLYAGNPEFLTENVSIVFTATGGNENPLHNEMIALGRTQNIVASSTAVTAMVKNKDPRRFAFYDVVPAQGSTPAQDTIAHILQGSYSTNTDKLVASPSFNVGGNAGNPKSALAPAKLFSVSESYFLQAEAVVRGWASGNATELYNNGIQESFDELGYDQAELDAYTAQASVKFPTGSVDNKIESIITQKYFAMCGLQGFEAWTEWRRTGYPTFFTVSKASRLGGDKMPLRLPYPDSEITSNGNFPGSVTIDKPVWWDVN